MNSNTNSENLSNTAKKNKETANEIVGQAKEAMSKTSEAVTNKAEDMAATTEHQAYKAGEMLRDYCDHMQCYAKHGVDLVQGKTRQNPIAALGAAFFAGMLIGKLSSLNTKK